MDYDEEPHGVYFFIDNKSFYASCESVKRGLNPLRSILVVMSEQANTNGGLILAASPMAKKLFGISNVSRQRDLPNDPRLLIVPPRMNLYIKKNLQINDVFTEFTDENNILPYSIDESLLDMTHTWHLFGNSLRNVALKIQEEVRSRLGLYTTVGIGDNPVQAKIALDVYAKHDSDLVGEIHYKDVPNKIWNIQNLTSVWGIGKRTAANLNHLRIYNMNDLAHANPYLIKEKMGIIGLQLFATAWGIDRSNLRQPMHTKEKSYSNSQVLPRDYTSRSEIEIVIKEVASQVASRIRNHHLQTGWITLFIGFSFATKQVTGSSGFSQSMKINPTDDSYELGRDLTELFERNWNGEMIRNIGVEYVHLSPKVGEQLDLFRDNQRTIKQNVLNKTGDQIRKQFGNAALLNANSLCNGATAISRSNLVGGHNGGNSYE
ncbi:ImpB MucB SamB family protein [Fructilactobacillus fructivorans]|uniref:Y-family DNA polymerase n=1 Tax=Fructilactobacillus fructivorans TaxID=1614 RepID=UPI000704F242|nr:Y-family DNA polymerase [Fructilactobacillus fructivorans]KRN13630.1 ImpB MucB SamB family protein [Fructilactobacillus fructivorans]